MNLKNTLLIVLLVVIPLLITVLVLGTGATMFGVTKTVATATSNSENALGFAFSEMILMFGMAQASGQLALVAVAFFFCATFGLSSYTMWKIIKALGELAGITVIITDSPNSTVNVAGKGATLTASQSNTATFFPATRDYLLQRGYTKDKGDTTLEDDTGRRRKVKILARPRVNQQAAYDPKAKEAALLQRPVK